jgi:hypothetical protein
MNLLYPEIPRARLVAMIRIAAVGALLAAVYGAVHDQVSYSISREYFTKVKFDQFAYADFGAPRRVFVAEVGVLATCWVGMIAGWVLGRVGFLDPATVSMRRDVLRAYGIVAVAAVTSGIAGLLLGMAAARGDLSGWREWKEELSLQDVPSFVTVAYLHWGSYLGGAAGVAIAVADARRRRPRA